MISLAEPVVERLLEEFESGVLHLRERVKSGGIETEDSGIQELILDFCFCSRLIRTDLRTVPKDRAGELAKRAVQLLDEAASLLVLPPNHKLVPFVQNIRDRAQLLRTEFAIK
ncbi:MAG: hypothetical protein JSS49_02405 [Planctomycetes bacterium]|nr:hypothetical protein [Planctomycetota bacterium]